MFFESLRAPALESIHLGLDSARFRHFKFTDPNTATCIAQCPLKRVEIEDTTVEGSELRALLELLRSVGSTLEELATTGGDVDVRLYQALTAEPTMLPNLRHLVIRKHNDLTGREILRLVQSRSSRLGITPLSILTVEKCRSFEHEMVDQIKQIIGKVDFTPY